MKTPHPRRVYPGLPFAPFEPKEEERSTAEKMLHAVKEAATSFRNHQSSESKAAYESACKDLNDFLHACSYSREVCSMIHNFERLAPTQKDQELNANFSDLKYALRYMS